MVRTECTISMCDIFVNKNLKYYVKDIEQNILPEYQIYNNIESKKVLVLNKLL